MIKENDIFRLFLFVSFNFLFIQIIQSQTEVSFSVDMNGTEFEEGSSIGLRGSIAPLDWGKSLEMIDPEKDGIYTVTVQFPDVKNGERLFYKYMAGDTWELDLHGESSNRAISLCNCPFILPVEKWNDADFSVEVKLLDAVHQEFNLWLYIIGSGKKKDKSIEVILSEYIDHWGNDFSWIMTPNDILGAEKFDQSKYEEGLYELMEEKAGMVKFKARNTFAHIISKYSNDGTTAGVSIEDMLKMKELWYRKMAEARGWKFEYALDGIDQIFMLNGN